MKELPEKRAAFVDSAEVAVVVADGLVNATWTGSRPHVGGLWAVVGTGPGVD